VSYGDLFDSLPASQSASRRRWMSGFGVSLAGHGVVLVAASLVVALRPATLPPPARTLGGILLYELPAAPPPPPLPLGRGALEGARPAPPPSLPSATALLAPVETPPDAPAVPADELPPGGSPTGSAAGSAEGMEGGEDGGRVGGLPGGTPGGVPGGTLGGTGFGPVPDHDRPPRPIHMTRPRYPQEAFVKKVEGTVHLEIVIDAEGRVVDARVVGSIPLLDAAALFTVKEWRFLPATRDGRPVPARASAPITFRIH
jgi:periplasmic protein TonB